ncbi:UDP-2,3-diacylglucosamine diphosphatase LpxI [Defluviimonas aestuarii]|uniref:LpxI family protein n=1 Tax=Albidovulum aestuarii TaxID=1130726 RepID=UPI00249B99F1|nr:UDP-2,3-diacylglucosamine diphosphatase LpxI [Defluviimonas aestuarii]MDI3335163.1 UDP-2,3-diacylglucosamine diphosphatase LpxI [Defluviimonas aestuarii]
MTKTALIAGQGGLPVRLAAALKASGEAHLIAEMEGFPADIPGADPVRYRIERLAPFLDHLAREGVTRVVFAGALRRPQIDPELIDARTATLVPRLLGAFQKGDDSLLREVIAIFEDWDFAVVGASDISPDLVPGAGVITGAPCDDDRRDAARAAEIVAGIGPLDIGQGAVVAQGLCLAVEALPGTDAMLAFVAEHAGRLRPNPNGARGVFYKAPKSGQDRRVDLPTLGPATVAAAAKAGLAGIVWEAGGVILIDREAMIAAAETAGLFLWAREP